MLTVAMTGLFWVPYILNRIMVRGLVGAMANPSPTEKAQSPWAKRMIAAHTKAVENLVIFAPLVLVAQQLNITDATTARRLASRWAPRAMNATSCPAAAIRPPKYPPTAPAAITAIRI